MDLYKEILIHILMNQDIQVTFPGIQALQKIKAVIDDDSLEDKECFIN